LWKQFIANMSFIFYNQHNLQTVIKSTVSPCTKISTAANPIFPLSSQLSDGSKEKSTFGNGAMVLALQPVSNLFR